MMYLLFAAAGVLCGLALIWILNRMPSRCFCDYDETPDERHSAPRVFYHKHGLISALVLAAAFALLSIRFGLGLTAIGLCVFCALLVMIALSDLRYCIIPDELIIAGCVAAVLAVLPGVLSGDGLWNRVDPALGCLAGAGFIFCINLVGRIVYHKDTLGMGDLKLMAICGIACGLRGIVIAALLGVFIAGLFFAIAIALKKLNREQYMPLGPFLVCGTIATLCFQTAIDAVLDWYISLI